MPDRLPRATRGPRIEEKCYTRQSMRSMALVGLLASGACTPVIPFYFAETAETLGKKDVSVSFAGGGGGAPNVDHCCGGGAIRFRVGLGHRMELGLETYALGAGTIGDGSLALGGKFSYKFAPIRYLALLFGVGATGTIGFGKTANGEAGVGSDFGLVASTPLLGRILRIYGGGRFSFVVPAARDIYDTGGPTQAFIVPVGFSVEPDRHWRFLFEGGYLGGFSENRESHPPAATSIGWNNGYGLFAVAYVWRSR